MDEEYIIDEPEQYEPTAREKRQTYNFINIKHRYKLFDTFLGTMTIVQTYAIISTRSIEQT